MTKSGNCCYSVMLCVLKNIDTIYHRMMNKVFKNQIGKILEVYMGDMIFKSEDDVDHASHLREVFRVVRKQNMRLNRDKSDFGVLAKKFFGFYLSEQGIKANLDKCKAFMAMPTLDSRRKIQVLSSMLVALSRFIAKCTQHAIPFYKFLRKKTAF